MAPKCFRMKVLFRSVWKARHDLVASYSNIYGTLLLWPRFSTEWSSHWTEDINFHKINDIIGY